jgi:hypothetical protein
MLRWGSEGRRSVVVRRLRILGLERKLVCGVIRFGDGMGSWTEICYIACIDVCICCADRCLGRGELGLVGWLGRVVMQMEL